MKKKKKKETSQMKVHNDINFPKSSEVAWVMIHFEWCHSVSTDCEKWTILFPLRRTAFW